MTLSVRAHPEAADELEAAVAWYEAELEGVGLELKASVDEVVERLAAGLVTGVRLRGGLERTGVRRIVLTRFPYDVVYEPRERELVIVAFSHHSRRPGYWRPRLAFSE